MRNGNGPPAIPSQTDRLTHQTQPTKTRNTYPNQEQAPLTVAAGRNGAPMPHDPITRALQRTDVSRRAKGLLVQILASDNPNLTTQGLIDAGPEGRAAVTSMLHELEALGYVRREQAREGYLFGPVRIVLADNLVERRNR